MIHLASHWYHSGTVGYKLKSLVKISCRRYHEILNLSLLQQSLYNLCQTSTIVTQLSNTWTSFGLDRLQKLVGWDLTWRTLQILLTMHYHDSIYESWVIYKVSSCTIITILQSHKIGKIIRLFQWASHDVFKIPACQIKSVHKNFSPTLLCPTTVHENW